MSYDVAQPRVSDPVVLRHLLAMEVADRHARHGSAFVNRQPVDQARKAKRRAAKQARRRNRSAR